jgi:ribosomal-protein-alanine N-acetyltransferase
LGKGYALEAARAAVEDGFFRLRLEEIVAITVVGNQRSRRTIERLGMTHDRTKDFDLEHPGLPPGHPLWRHVLYRLRRPP